MVEVGGGGMVIVILFLATQKMVGARVQYNNAVQRHTLAERFVLRASVWFRARSGKYKV